VEEEDEQEVEAEEGEVEPDVPAVHRGRAEAALLGSAAGTWAERVSWLLVQLARGCGLLALQISGWARGGLLGACLMPGQTLAAHNHCWAAVKVNGRWRLLDPADAVLHGGSAQFFTPPAAFAHCHLPFEPFWQLLEAPLSAQQWWELPEASPQFFAAGMRLLSSGLGAVNAVPAPRPGGRQPVVRLRVAAPEVANQRLQLAVLGEQLQEISSWQHGSAGDGAAGLLAGAAAGQPQLVFQQAAVYYCDAQQLEPESGQSSSELLQLVMLPGTAAAAACPASAVSSVAPLEVGFGAARFSSRVSELWAALPGPGRWYLELRLVRTLPGAVQLRLQGLEHPLCLDIRTSEKLVRVSGAAAALPGCRAAAGQVLPVGRWPSNCWLASVHLQARFDVPPPAQHDPDTDPLQQLGGGSAAMVPPATLPHATPAFTALQCQLLAPAPPQRLEADRLCGFRLAVPGGRAVVVGSGEAGWWPLQRDRPRGAAGEQQQQQQAGDEEVPVFSADVELPRCATCHVLVALGKAAAALLPEPLRSAAAAGWVPLLALPVAAQVQTVVAVPQPAVCSTFLESDPLVRTRRLVHGASMPLTASWQCRAFETAVGLMSTELLALERKCRRQMGPACSGSSVLHLQGACPCRMDCTANWAITALGGAALALVQQPGTQH
jgi:hypothetical protein